MAGQRPRQRRRARRISAGRFPARSWRQPRANPGAGVRRHAKTVNDRWGASLRAHRRVAGVRSSGAPAVVVARNIDLFSAAEYPEPMPNHDKPKSLEPASSSQNQIDELRRAEKSVEHRLAALEDSVKEMRKSNLEGHKWFTTVMFTLVALLLTVVGIMSKSDVREAIRDMKSDMRDVSADMQNKVEKATGEMEKNFQNMAGESIKKPLLTIATRAGFLDGQVFDISQDKRFPILPLFLKNEGDKKTGGLSIRLAASCDLGLQNNGWTWQQVESNQKDLSFWYYYRGEAAGEVIGVAPKETLTFTGGQMLPNIFPAGLITNGIIDCKLQIFYEAEKPAEAKFQLKLR